MSCPPRTSRVHASAFSFQWRSTSSSEKPRVGHGPRSCQTAGRTVKLRSRAVATALASAPRPHVAPAGAPSVQASTRSPAWPDRPVPRHPDVAAATPCPVPATQTYAGPGAPGTTSTCGGGSGGGVLTTTGSATTQPVRRSAAARPSRRTKRMPAHRRLDRATAAPPCHDVVLELLQGFTCSSGVFKPTPTV